MIDINKEKIDIVYTWVDGNDPAWREKKEEYLKKEKGIPVASNNNCRYRNNDELKYSLRSLEKYANWINKIYIITDNQIPDWLDISNPRVRIVDHSEIIPKEYLPVFNSNAILHNLSNINDLSEFYLYSDDDMFFCNHVEKSFFFQSDGYPFIRFNRFFKSNKEDSYICIINNACNLIESQFKQKINLTPHHNIDAYRKSDVLNCKKLFANTLKETMSNRFRTDNDVERVLYMYYAIVMKHGYIKGIYAYTRYLPYYKNKISSYFKKLYKKDSLYFRNDATLWNYSFLDTKVKLFCINDIETTQLNDIEKTHAFLEKMFPQKSEFEK